MVSGPASRALGRLLKGNAGGRGLYVSDLHEMRLDRLLM